jgi:hypothetical protein
MQDVLNSTGQKARSMRRAVWSIYFHTFASNETPSHGLCPSGPDSWCKYNVALAKKELFYHTKVISSAVTEVVKPIFQDLATDDLLRRCLHGTTQNQNESFNNGVWSYLPKSTFIGH